MYYTIPISTPSPSSIIINVRLSATSENNTASASASAVPNLARVGPTFQYAPEDVALGEFQTSASPMNCGSAIYDFSIAEPSGFPGLNLLGRVIKLPALPIGAVNPRVYFLKSADNWTPLSDQTFQEGVIRANLENCGYYQVFAQVPNLEFRVREAYVYPNPVPPKGTGTLFVETGDADRLKIRIYDVAGDQVFETEVSGKPTNIQGKLGYEVILPMERFRAGVYVGVAEAFITGQDSSRQNFRFSVLK